MNETPSPNKFLPILASHWNIDGKDISIALQQEAKWQNGSPVTSNDVLATLIIDGSEAPGGSTWPFVSSITAPTAKTLTIHVKADFSAEEVLQQVLQIVPVRERLYAPLLPESLPALEAEVLAENQTENGEPTPSALKAKNKLAEIFKKVAGYNPRSTVGDGPYKVVSQTIESATITKWPGYNGASKVHVKKIRFLSVGAASDLIPLQHSGALNMSWLAFSNLTEAHAFLSDPHNHVHSWFGLSTQSYFFNQYRYPFDILAVRQAIAYVVHLSTLDHYGRGVGSGLSVEDFWHPKKYVDGLNGPNEVEYLTPSTKRDLTAYNYNPAKATRLLRSAGFRKVGGQWLLPNGKPFTVDVYQTSDYLDPSSQVLPSYLKAFGIQSKLVPLSGTEEEKALSTLGPGIAFGYGAFDANPFSSLLSMAADYVVGAPPSRDANAKVDVPGVGDVNIVTALTQEQDSISGGKVMRRLVNSWAKYYNRQVDFLTYSNYNFQYQYSTVNYRDWPSASNPLWGLGGHFRLIFEFVLHGYLRPT